MLAVRLRLQVAHLGRTHFLTEAFAVATRRCFDEDHPLSYLLRVHTRFLIANNSLGRDALIGPGGSVDRLLAGYVEESVEMARVAVVSTDFLKGNFKNDMAARDVGRERLPHYPYRDDGQRLWQAISDFALEYLGAYYASDADLQADKQVQRFCAELADPTQGAVKGMPAAVETLEELAEILTTLIFISGPGHSAGVLVITRRPCAIVPLQPIAPHSSAGLTLCSGEMRPSGRQCYGHNPGEAAGCLTRLACMPWPMRPYTVAACSELHAASAGVVRSQHAAGGATPLSGTLQALSIAADHREGAADHAPQPAQYPVRSYPRS